MRVRNILIYYVFFFVGVFRCVVFRREKDTATPLTNYTNYVNVVLSKRREDKEMDALVNWLSQPPSTELVLWVVLVEHIIILGYLVRGYVLQRKQAIGK